MISAGAEQQLATAAAAERSRQRPVNLHQGHGDLAFTIVFPTHSRSSLKMKGFEPSIDIDFENSFFEKRLPT